MNHQQANHKEWIEQQISKLILPQGGIETNPANRVKVEQNSNMDACKFTQEDGVSILAVYVLGIPDKGANPVGAAVVFRHDGARLYEVAESIQGGALCEAAARVAATFASGEAGLVIEHEEAVITDPEAYAQVVQTLVQENYCIGLEDIGFDPAMTEKLIKHGVEPYEWVNEKAGKYGLQRDGVMDPEMPLTKLDQDAVTERLTKVSSEPEARPGPRP